MILSYVFVVPCDHLVNWRSTSSSGWRTTSPRYWDGPITEERNGRPENRTPEMSPIIRRYRSKSHPKGTGRDHLHKRETLSPGVPSVSNSPPLSFVHPVTGSPFTPVETKVGNNLGT